LIGSSHFHTTRLNPEGFDINQVQGSPWHPFHDNKTPLIVTVHTLIKTEKKYGEHKHSFRAWVGTWAENETLNHANKIIVVHPCLIDEYNEYERINPNIDIRTIPNGVNFEEFNGRQMERENMLMSAGRDIPRKDFATFREACKRSSIPYA